MNEAIEEALMHIEVVKGMYEPIKKHSHMGYPMIFDKLHKELVEAMMILEKNNYTYPEKEKKLLDELNLTFYSQCSSEYKKTGKLENWTELTL